MLRLAYHIKLILWLTALKADVVKRSPDMAIANLYHYFLRIKKPNLYTHLPLGQSLLSSRSLDRK
jgi:hypothetical protein